MENRALAAIAVFAVHLDQNSDVAGTIGSFSLHQLCVSGRHGVAVFFLLTGYLLAAPLWRYSLEERGSKTLPRFGEEGLGKFCRSIIWSCYPLPSSKDLGETAQDFEQYLLHALRSQFQREKPLFDQRSAVGDGRDCSVLRVFWRVVWDSAAVQVALEHLARHYFRFHAAATLGNQRSDRPVESMRWRRLMVYGNIRC